MNHLWVELQKEFLGKPVGEKVKLASEAEKKSLIEGGFAKDCESPESDVVLKAAESLVTKTMEGAANLVDVKIKELTSQINKSFNEARIPSFAIAKGSDGADEFDPKLSFRTLGEYAMWIRDFTRPGSPEQSAVNKSVSYFDAIKKAPTGMYEMSDPDGGALVPPDFAASVWARVQQNADILGRTTSFTVNGNSLTIPADSELSRANGSRRGGVLGYWVGEADQYTGSRPKFRKLTMNLHKLTVLTYVTDELIADSATALESYLTRAAGDEITFKIGDALINGTGAGLPLGVLNATALISVSKETGQAAATLVFENILKMWARMYAPSRANSVWYINQDVEPQLYSLSQAIGTGGVPVYLPPGGLSQGPYGTLFGRPVVPTEFNATLGTVGDIILADYSQYASMTKGGVKSATSMHLRFDYDEVAFKWSFRMDAQPLWQSALTPFKGSNTQSPFIALATRA